LLARPIPSLRPSDIYDTSPTPRIEALADSIPVRSALHLLNDDIDHAQSDDGNLTSNYLHAQLHTREGDYWNSKVSFTGVHSRAHYHHNIGGLGLECNLRTLYSTKCISAHQAKKFVDDCQAATASCNKELKAKQWQELKSTLEYAIKKKI
ncbi:hypothetical protein DFS33DRAFT_1472300, partial [Desarmillaria ectypa]